MNAFAVITARAGSVEVRNKNILPIGGKPCFKHNVDLLNQSKHVKSVYVSTDIVEILDSYDGYIPIDRPAWTCREDVEGAHYGAIRHALGYIESDTDCKIDYLIVGFGNTVTAFPDDVDRAIEILENDKTIDTVASVTKFNMFNPFRAKCIKDGMLESFFSPQLTKQYAMNDRIQGRDSFGDILFVNGSFSVIRRCDIVDDKIHDPVYPWFGKRVKPIIQESAMEIDASWQVVCMEELVK